MKLYEIPDEFRAIGEMITEAEGEITPEIAARMEAAEGTLHEKVDALCYLIREAVADSDSAGREMSRLRQFKAAADNRENRLREYLLRSLGELGLDGVKTATNRVSRRRAGQPSIRWGQAIELLPCQFRRTTFSVDLVVAHEAYLEDRLPEGFVVDYKDCLVIR
jgi:hypothetical protein